MQVKFLPVLLLAALGWCSSAAAQDANSESRFLVYCYDAAREVVTRELTVECHGKVVTEAEAKELQGRRAQLINRALSRAAQPAPPGTRLVSIGTAFFINETGHLLTNNHVIDGCKGVVIEPTEADSVPAKVLAVDVADDLALLQAAMKPPTYASFRGPTPLDPGSFVATVGYPDQGIPPRQPMVTAGKVEDHEVRPGDTGPVMRIRAGNAILVQADIRHGNSGGPLFDEHALVIGVVRAKLNIVKVYRDTGKLVPDTGMGIPEEAVLRFLTSSGVTYRIGQPGGPLDAPQILASARPYMARASCWK
jgi:serine protease Do